VVGYTSHPDLLNRNLMTVGRVKSIIIDEERGSPEKFYERRSP